VINTENVSIKTFLQWRRAFFNGEEISREMGLCYARRLLLDFGKGCPYYEIEAIGKTKKKIT
jgi:hypothetical protein